MQQEQPWFRPFVERLAELLYTKEGWSVQMRVALCAVLTYLDVASDIYMIRYYHAADELAAAYMSLGFIGLNMACQIVVCVENTGSGYECACKGLHVARSGCDRYPGGIVDFQIEYQSQARDVLRSTASHR
jgi:hypothetical protein